VDHIVLQELSQAIRKDKIDSCIIYQNESIRFEYYRNSKMKLKLHKINSVTKSIVSALYGIAIEQGFIEHIYIPIGSYFKNLDECKKQITLQHLLTMTSGLQWPGNPAMIPTRNWVQFILAQPVIYPPGMHMKYSCGNSHLLSAILQKATGMDTHSFAKKYLFEPLGIDNCSWHKDAQGIAIGGFSITMKTEDLLKLGLLYLHNGLMNDKQLIPSKWITESTTTKIPAGNRGYGYHWWLLEKEDGPGRTFYAMGMAGQYILVNQEQQLVVVFTSSIDDDASRPIQYFKDLILGRFP
jgi:CubicO group peptidase (beta-lactamase class C family)